MDKLQSIKGQEHAKRAMEVAACGGLAVALVGPPGCGKTMLADCFGDYVGTVVEAWPCRCGELGCPAHECRCTLSQAKSVKDNIKAACEEYGVAIMVEVPELRLRELQSDGRYSETWGAVESRIRAVRDLRAKRPDDDRMTLDGDCLRLLEMAVDRLGFNPRAVDKVKSVARVIADMDNSQSIRSPHLAEAIQYRSIDRG
jgi:magnesium chelatase family protein